MVQRIPINPPPVSPMLRVHITVVHLSQLRSWRCYIIIDRSPWLLGVPELLPNVSFPLRDLIQAALHAESWCLRAPLHGDGVSVLLVLVILSVPRHTGQVLALYFQDSPLDWNPSGIFLLMRPGCLGGRPEGTRLSYTPCPGHTPSAWPITVMLVAGFSPATLLDFPLLSTLSETTKLSSELVISFPCLPAMTESLFWAASSPAITLVNFGF